MKHLELQQKLGDKITSLSKHMDTNVWCVRTKNPNQVYNIALDMYRLGVDVVNVSEELGFIYCEGIE